MLQVSVTSSLVPFSFRPLGFASAESWVPWPTAVAVGMLGATSVQADDRVMGSVVQATAGVPASSCIVQFRSGSDRASELAKAKALGMTVTHLYGEVLSRMAVRADKDQAAALPKNPNVQLVEVEGIATSSDTQNGATWGLGNTDHRSLPLSATYTYGWPQATSPPRSSTRVSTPVTKTSAGKCPVDSPPSPMPWAPHLRGWHGHRHDER